MGQRVRSPSEPRRYPRGVRRVSQRSFFSGSGVVSCVTQPSPCLEVHWGAAAWSEAEQSPGLGGAGDPLGSGRGGQHWHKHPSPSPVPAPRQPCQLPGPAQAGAEGMEDCPRLVFLRRARPVGPSCPINRLSPIHPRATAHAASTGNQPGEMLRPSKTLRPEGSGAAPCPSPTTGSPGRGGRPPGCDV